MTPLIIAGAIFVVVFALMARLLPGSGSGAQQAHTRKSLQRIQSETASSFRQDEAVSVVRHYRMAESETLDQLLRMIPGTEKLFALTLKSGVQMPFGVILGIMAGLFAVLAIVAATIGAGPLGVLGALAVGIYVPIWYLRRRIRKRNEKFINMFPDAVDMIVRSVRSGHPLQAALKMIADNMDPPVSTEFKQVVDEIAYGRTVQDALMRLSSRLTEPDLTFFVVVVSVQQETGGNLAEVLSNLSSIIRRRKQIRLKIKALTSEGRMTAIILGSLPFMLFGVLYIVAPTYLTPLFHDHTGRFILGLAVGMVATAFTIVRRMINIDI